MRVILIQMKVAKALKGEKNLPTELSEAEKNEVMELVCSTIILHL